MKSLCDGVRMVPQACVFECLVLHLRIRTGDLVREGVTGDGLASFESPQQSRLAFLFLSFLFLPDACGLICELSATAPMPCLSAAMLPPQIKCFLLVMGFCEALGDLSACMKLAMSPSTPRC